MGDFEREREIFRGMNTMNESINNIRVVAEVLFGKREAKAGWPLRYKIEEAVTVNPEKGVGA
jgi:hypothetical protein